VRDEVQQLRVARADSIHVPGGDLQERGFSAGRIAAARNRTTRNYDITTCTRITVNLRYYERRVLSQSIED
jgi:hypothetical protein